jgi:hypothetical protein
MRFSVKALVNEIFNGNPQFRNPHTHLEEHQDGIGGEWRQVEVCASGGVPELGGEPPLVAITLHKTRNRTQLTGMSSYMTHHKYVLVSVVVTRFEGSTGAREFWWAWTEISRND